MILLKSALSSILVVLGACDRAADGSSSARSEADVTAPSTAAARPVASGDSGSATTIVSARPSPSTERKASPHAAVKPTVGGARNGAKTVYVCPMHPEVVSDTPGLCPKCNMKLDPKPQVTETRQPEERQHSPNWP